RSAEANPPDAGARQKHDAPEGTDAKATAALDDAATNVAAAEPIPRIQGDAGATPPASRGGAAASSGGERGPGAQAGAPAPSPPGSPEVSEARPAPRAPGPAGPADAGPVPHAE